MELELLVSLLLFTERFVPLEKQSFILLHLVLSVIGRQGRLRNGDAESTLLPTFVIYDLTLSK